MNPETIKHVERLLRRGLSQLAIANRLGLTWTAVYRIASGADLPRGEHDEKAPRLGDPARARRCSGCGALIYVWPCLHCANKTVAKKRIA